jgi:hypothetical protein
MMFGFATNLLLKLGHILGKLVVAVDVWFCNKSTSRVEVW